MTTSLEIMHRMFREQHRQMIEEQKRLLDDYKQYFEGVLREMEEQDRLRQSPVVVVPQKNTEQKEDMLKEIAELGALLDDAVKTYGKELAEILTELTERQRKRAEANLSLTTEESTEVVESEAEVKIS